MSVQICVDHYDAFTKVPGKGNPAGVILSSETYTPEQMQAAAKAVGYNEICFLCPSDKADIRLRFFMPGQEVGLCGHATMGTVYAWASKMQLKEDRILKVETLTGILDIGYRAASDEVEMEQANARFLPFEGDRGALMSAIGLTEDDIDERWPICFGWTGLWTLILPVKNKETFLRMKPDNKRFPAILSQCDHASVHPVCFDCFDPSCDMHGRHFSSPFSGSVEDPVTGTASGVMGAYYLRFIDTAADQADLKIEQGYEIGREGCVHVIARREGEEIAVRIYGRAVYNESFTVEV